MSQRICPIFPGSRRVFGISSSAGLCPSGTIIGSSPTPRIRISPDRRLAENDSCNRKVTPIDCLRKLSARPSARTLLTKNAPRLMEINLTVAIGLSIPELIAKEILVSLYSRQKPSDRYPRRYHNRRHHAPAEGRPALQANGSSFW